MTPAPRTTPAEPRGGACDFAILAHAAGVPFRPSVDPRPVSAASVAASVVASFSVWTACVAGAHAGDDPPEPLVLSEIRIDQPSTDLDEWIELRGEPGTPLKGLSIVVIGDGAPDQGSGVIEEIVALSGAIPASRFFVIAEKSFSLGEANLVRTLNFENSDTLTFMLVRGFVGAIGQDLDANDDGSLDATPWAEALDSIAVLESDATPPVGTEWGYGLATVGPAGNLSPWHVQRCNDLDEWRTGSFDPIGGLDRPGMSNLWCYEPPFCLGDLVADRDVNASDLAILLSEWGTAQGGPADLNGDGFVSAADLALLLSVWGACPE